MSARRALITGAGGFVGRYLAQHLQAKHYDVWGMDIVTDDTVGYQAVSLDLRDASAVKTAVSRIKPHEIYHLASISQPGLGLIHEFYDVNLTGTLNLFEAARPTGARILCVSSAYVYGSYETIITEDMPLKPMGHYAISKAAADLAAFSYARQGLPVVRVRPFNHTGPGQSDAFVVPSIVRQVAAIAAGAAPPVLKLGNLETIRDLSDVRDIVAAYPALLQSGEIGAAYNLSRGSGISIRQLVEKVIAIADLDCDITIDENRRRRSDIPFLVGDSTRAAETVGWHPSHSLDQTIADLLQHENAKLT